MITALIIIIVVAVLCAGAVITFIGTRLIERAHRPRGRFIDIGGFPQHVVETGPRDAHDTLPGEQLDLVEAWGEMTGLPFCYGLWCRSRGALTQEDMDALRTAHQEAQARAGDSAAPFQYLPTEETDESLRTFLHYAYYHGVLPDVPDVNTRDAADEDEEDDSGPDPSVN